MYPNKGIMARLREDKSYDGRTPRKLKYNRH